MHGVSFGHWQFLRILWATNGLTQRALSVQAGVMEPTTFAAVTAMARAGYVERRHNPGNRKSMHVCLTHKGRALKRKRVPLAEEVNALGVAGVSATDVAITRTALLAIIANLAAAEVQDQSGSRSPASPARPVQSRNAAAVK